MKSSARGLFNAADYSPLPNGENFVDASSEGSGEDESESCGLCIQEYFTVYKVPKIVKVRSSALQIPRICCDCAIVVAISVYSFAYRLEFTKESESDGIAVVRLVPPLQNFWACRNIEIDCQPDPLNEHNYSYCKPNSFTPCKHFEIRDMSPEVASSRDIFIATSAEILEQERNDDLRVCNRTWCTRNDSLHYIAGIENYMVQVRHSFASTACSNAASSWLWWLPATIVGCNNVNTQGFLKFLGNASRGLPDSRAKFSCGHDTCLSKTYALWDTVPHCGNTKPNFNDTCFSSVYSDWLSVGTILKSAGVSLDELGGGRERNRRSTGTTIVMKIVMENGGASEFWAWPHGPPELKRRYTYSFQEVPHWEEAMVVTREVPHTDATRRRLILFKGLQLLVQPVGQLRELSLFHFLVSFTIFFTATKLSTLAVESCLLNIYKCCEGRRHIKPMFEHFAKDESPHDWEFQNNVNEERDIHSIQQVVVHRRNKETWKDISGAGGDEDE